MLLDPKSSFSVLLRFSLCGAADEIGPKVASFLSFRYYTHLDTRTDLNSSKTNNHFDTEAPTYTINIQYLSGIRTRDHSSQAAADPLFRPHDKWKRLPHL
jgi:hypothetical protein